MEDLSLSLLGFEMRSFCSYPVTLLAACPVLYRLCIHFRSWLNTYLEISSFRERNEAGRHLVTFCVRTLYFCSVETFTREPVFVKGFRFRP